MQTTTPWTFASCGSSLLRCRFQTTTSPTKKPRCSYRAFCGRRLSSLTVPTNFTSTSRASKEFSCALRGPGLRRDCQTLAVHTSRILVRLQTLPHQRPPPESSMKPETCLPPKNQEDRPMTMRAYLDATKQERQLNMHHLVAAYTRAITSAHPSLFGLDPLDLAAIAARFVQPI